MVYAIWISLGIVFGIGLLAIFGDVMIEPIDEINDEDFSV
jgi:hypothetical protein